MTGGMCPICGHQYDLVHTVTEEEYMTQTWGAHCKEENDDGTVTVYHNI